MKNVIIIAMVSNKMYMNCSLINLEMRDGQEAFIKKYSL